MHPWRASPLDQPHLLRPRVGLRHLSTTAPLRAQYTRFSSNGRSHAHQGQWDPRTKIIAFIGAGGVVYYVAHLEQVPETGRLRFMDISPKYEAKLAQVAYAELLSEFQGKILPAHHPITRHVRRVVTDILDASDLGTLHSSEPRRSLSGSDDLWRDDPFSAARPNASPPEIGGKEWNLLVVDDPKVINAMATFGNIVVFTGILPICKDEHGLAAVLGHEIGHVVARHAPERYSYSKVLILFAFLLQSVGLDIGITNLLSKLLLELPNSRTQELEADTIGMHLTAKACHDPQAAIEVHKRLAKHEQAFAGSTLEFLRTHPGEARRIQHLQELIPKAHSIMASSPRCAWCDRFHRAVPWRHASVELIVDVLWGHGQKEICRLSMMHHSVKYLLV
ncbi:peptidase family M48-domain-containing protein [Melanogaster broomeanus]|nr:peptidase family M48-domain-containing protein [Melanogaster broomeanus]